ncbi:glycoside hydrolase family 15 protein [Bacteroidota bacterium]
MNNLNYGVVGNCRSAALVSERGTIEWLCLPDFNSPSVFAKILDRNKGGEFSIEVDKGFEIQQSYVDYTNILSTVFQKGMDKFEVIDFMPRFKSDDGTYYNPPDIVRYIKVISGNPKVVFNYNPKLFYAKEETVTLAEDEFIKSYTAKGTYESLYLYTNLEFDIVLNKSEVELSRDVFFLISYNQKIEEIKLNKMYLKLQRTKVYWMNWSERTMRVHKYNNEVFRSALVLKLLTYQKTGAILAAVTTSIPEKIGGVRNWDYRYCWIRDASQIIKVLATLGHLNGARRFLDFVTDIIPVKDEKIQIMYGIRGEKILTEEQLDHLEGYEESKPVRIGNSAYLKKQKDIYGVLMDVLYQNFQLYKKSQEATEELWTIVRSVAKIVAGNWKNMDKGVWETRSEEKHFTFSKVLCWVAIDRGIKIAELIGKNNYVEEWIKLRDEIKESIIKNAWSDQLKAFKQAYEVEAMDSTNLLMQNYGFLEANDPKYISTVKATKEHLLYNGLMFGYKTEDDFGVPSSAFTISTFWLIRSLTLIGEVEEAEKLFIEILKLSNHLGLFSENIDVSSKRLLGNFPHGGSHFALIETAIHLSRVRK